jgi:ubiquinone/menaquinone biosynthesis C-methylase UbiE
VNVDLQPGRNGLAVCADAHSLPFRDGAFALIVAKDSLEHFENPWRAMEEIRRTLADGGALVIWVPFMHVGLSRGRFLPVYSSGF